MSSLREALDDYLAYGQDKAEKSISRLEWFAANCGMGAIGVPAGRVASAA